MSQHSEPTTEASIPALAPLFTTLLVGHDPNDPAEATIAIAAVASRCGLRADGSSMAVAAETATRADAVLAQVLEERGITKRARRRRGA